ncbi:gliding motility lipoprotein GldB [Arenibacter sp. 6A1]|uniref:gliding motility lipoprotein GldB n=1 Tax=Arenibacter sp. 6A1 TaxID=2720391 RepID=UPI001F0FE337|nr:gliding motility lipoprotein GldB [Arenibacter sp. 6A1]
MKLKENYFIMNYFTLFFGILVLMFVGCKKDDKIAEEISRVKVEIDISRFEREFAQAEAKDIPVLKQKYPYLFPEQYPDSVWVQKLNDSLQVEILEQVGQVFPDFNTEQEELERLFKHIKYYFPKAKAPKVITLISDVDYHNRVIFADSLLLLGLDNYLGPSHKFYQGISSYIAAGLDKGLLVSDVCSAWAKTVIPAPKDRSFLSQLIYYGKELYLKDKIMPFKSDFNKIGYAPQQLDWAVENEDYIWRYFIERELLYSTDYGLRARFLDPAPFSKFRLTLDNETPGRIGRFVGWQIVRAFMENNKVGLDEMLSLPEEELFKKSGYKPKK